MSLTIPFTFVAATKAKASEVNANFAAVAAKFTQGAGGILDEDISTSAAIKGTKISNTPGNAIPTDRLEAEAVTDAKLANDTANPGLDSGRAVSGDHIKALTEAHLDRILPLAGIGADRLKFTVHPVAFSFSALGAINAAVVTGVAANPTISFPKATYDLVGLFIKNQTVTTATVLTPIANDVAANWAGSIQALNALDNGGAETAAGSLVYVFQQKA